MKTKVFIAGCLAAMLCFLGCKNTKEVVIKSISLPPSLNTLAIGQSVDVIATVMPTDATDEVLSWFMLEEGIVTIEASAESHGRKVTVKAIGEGKTSIYATNANKSVRSSNVSVTVNSSGSTVEPIPEGLNAYGDNIDVTSIVFTINDIEFFDVWTNDGLIGGQIYFTASARYGILSRLGGYSELHFLIDDEAVFDPPIRIYSGLALSNNASDFDLQFRYDGSNFFLTDAYITLDAIPAGEKATIEMEVEANRQRRQVELDVLLQYLRDLGKVREVELVPVEGTLLPLGSTWRYFYCPREYYGSGTSFTRGANAPRGWPEPNVATWDSGMLAETGQGTAPLGWGMSGVVTTLPAVTVEGTAGRGVWVHYMTTFNVSDVVNVSALRVTVPNVADGVSLWINGHRIGDKNAAGLFSSVDGGGAGTGPGSWLVDPAVLRQGENIIAARTHQGYQSDPNSIFDCQVEAFVPSPVERATIAAMPKRPVYTLDPDGVLRSYRESEIVWEDNFDQVFSYTPGAGCLDPSRWNAENNSTYGHTNRTENWLMSREENLFVQDGLLYLRALKHDTPQSFGTPPSDGIWDRYFTCGYIHTRNTSDATRRTAWNYGRFEIRAKFPLGNGTSRGTWPAFWIQPSPSSNPLIPMPPNSVGEIDIFEGIGSGTTGSQLLGLQQQGSAYRSLSNDRMIMSVHYDYQSPHVYPAYTESWIKPAEWPGWSDAFHVFAVEWDQDAIRWFVNDRVVFEVTRESLPWYDAVFNAGKAREIRVSHGIGGSWPGSPDTATAFPSDYVVDYVRVYQHADQGQNNLGNAQRDKR